MWICRASASLAVDALSCVRRRTSQECPNDRWIRQLGVISGTGSRRTTEPAAEPPGKISVVGKAAGIGNLAERLPRAKHLPAMNEAGSVVEANRLDEAAAGGVVRREELLQVTQRDPGLGRRFPGTEGRIGKAIPNDVTDALEQLGCSARDQRQIRRHEQRAQQIVDGELHVGAGWRAR
jgi:hypothetical protein